MPPHAAQGHESLVPRRDREHQHGLRGVRPRAGPPGRHPDPRAETLDFRLLSWDAIYGAIARASGALAKLVHVPSALIAALVPDRGASLLGDKAHSSVFDNSKVRRLVPEFQPRVTFAEGVARSVRWFDEDPRRRVVSPAANDSIERVLAAWGRAWDGLPEGGPR